MSFELEDTVPQCTTSAPGTPVREGLSGAVSKVEPEIAPQRVQLRWWRLARNLLRLCLYGGLVLYGGGRYAMGRFDKNLLVAKPVRVSPHQEHITEAPFFFSYGDHEYRIEPIASYDISGLLVSHNEVSSITDAYHTSASVDFRDLCLVWGTNVTSGVFRRMKFWSEPWSCHYRTDDRQAAMSFNPSELSNTHLLAPDPKVRRRIQSMRIGDQVRLQGMLINYAPKWSPESLRRTSTVRDDTGNGACEVLWVEAAQVLVKGSTGWHLLQDLGFWLLITAVTGGLTVFLLAPVALYRGR